MLETGWGKGQVPFFIVLSLHSRPCPALLRCFFLYILEKNSRTHNTTVLRFFIFRTQVLKLFFIKIRSERAEKRRKKWLESVSTLSSKKVQLLCNYYYQCYPTLSCYDVELNLLLNSWLDHEQGCRAVFVRAAGFYCLNGMWPGNPDDGYITTHLLDSPLSIYINIYIFAVHNSAFFLLLTELHGLLLLLCAPFAFSSTVLVGAYLLSFFNKKM